MKNDGSKKINNETAPKANIDIQCGAKGTINNEGIPKLSFQGYSGQAVNLSDYGFDHPVVYDISNMSTKQKIPILYNHSEAVGHTTNIRKVENGSAVRGKGLASLPGESTSRIVNGLKNGFPFEASMGLRGDYDQIDFVSNGTISVNNREFKAPIYVWKNTKLSEMTVTEFGRDSDTSFEVINKDQLMRIKNQTPSTPPAPTTPPEPKVENTPPVTPPAPKVENTPPTPEPKVENTPPIPPTPPVHVPNTLDPNLIRAMTLTSKYPEHTDDILNGLGAGWSDEHITNSIELKVLNQKLPKPPKSTPENQSKINNELFARTCLSFGAKPELLEKKLDKKVVENAHNKPQLSITELLLNVANSQGGRFTGHSDVEEMCNFIRNTGYSTFDLPDFFEKVGSMLKEERWEINPPFAPSMCKEGSNKDFRTVEKARITGGEMWKQVGNDGKLDLYSMSGQKKYQSTLATYGSLFTLDRETIINDDQDVLNDMMDAMVEGAMMIPDYQLGLKMLKQAAAASSFWVDADNSFTATALTRTNLSARYKAIRKYTETRNDGINWTVMLNDRWTLVVAPDLEEAAWDIVKQDKVVSNTTADTIQGEKNYWFGRLDIKVFPQMGNTAAFGTGTFATETTWMLWPSSLRFAPYEIAYLRGRKTPTIESVQLPATMLGFGTRGYWDVNVNERERTAVMRSKA